MMSLLGRAVRPLAIVISALTLLFALAFGATGCGRSSFDDEDLTGSIDTDSGDVGDSDPETLTDTDPDVPTGVLTNIIVEPSSNKVPVGSRVNFRARGFYSDGGERDLTSLATWNSNNPGVASSAGGGVVSANRAGEARIRATYLGLFGEADVIVTGATVVDLQITPPGADIAVGGSTTFRAIAVFAGGGTSDVTFSSLWSVDNPGVAKISSGFVTGTAPGFTTVRATFSGRTGYAKLSVSGKTLSRIEISPFAPTLAVGSSLAMFATAIYTDGTRSDITTLASWISKDPMIANVSTLGGGAMLRGFSPGATAIAATYAGFSASTPVTVTGGTLTGITVSPSTATLAPGGSTTLQAIANYSDGSSVDVTSSALWRSSNEPVASVSSGVVRANLAGSTLISAQFGGRTGVATITVSPAKLVSITISPASATLPLGSTRQLTARGTYEGGSVRDITNDVTWTTDASTIASVSNATGSKGLATPVAIGSTTARASLDGVTGTASLTVTAAALTKIAISPDPLSLVRGTKQFAKATGTYSDGTTIDVSTTCTWSTADTTIATVSNGAGAQGQVTANNVGTTTLSCTQSGVTGSARLSVTAPALEQVSVSPIAPTCRVGDMLQFQATAISTGGGSSNVTFTAMWSSSAPTIVQYTGSPGRFRCIAKGSATISASYGGKTGTTPVTVTDAVIVSIQVDPASNTLAAGTTQQYQATALFSDGTSRNVTLDPGTTWSSANSGVASVGNAGFNKGQVTAIAAGSTSIRATYAGVTGSASLTVTSATIVSISINPSFASVPAGVTFPYSATAIYSDGTSRDITATATWTSSNGSVAAVSNALGSKGQAQTFAAGTTTISASLSGVTGKATLNVTAAKLVAVQITPFNPKLPVGYGIRLTATGVWDDGFTANVTGQATWTSSNGSVASVSNAVGSKGRVTPIAAGTATISAQYNGVSGSTTVTVTSATLTTIAVTPNPAGVAVSSSQQLTATGTFSDGSTLDITDYVGWFSSDPTVADVSNATDSKGLAFGFKSGTVTVTATRGTISGRATLNVK
jgi:uncharacterized protein YjdB